MSDGRTTEAPLLMDMPQFYIGNEYHFITFCHLILDDGRVVVHSQLFDVTEKMSEDFLYEVVDRHEAYRCAATMIDDAEEYLTSVGVNINHRNGSPLVFLDRLEVELRNKLH